RLSNTQRDFLREAAQKYHASLDGSPAAEHLEKRGMMGAARPKVDEFLLGYVDDPLPGHESYKGMLAIPYIRPTFDGELLVATIRFRCLLDHEHEFHGKYNTMPGDRRRMYN